MRYLFQHIENCGECPFFHRSDFGVDSPCRNDPAGRTTNGLGEPPEWCPLPDNPSGVGFVRLVDIGKDRPRDNLDQD
jgi:hypothetical protein